MKGLREQNGRKHRGAGGREETPCRLSGKNAGMLPAPAVFRASEHARRKAEYKLYNDRTGCFVSLNS